MFIQIESCMNTIKFYVLATLFIATTDDLSYTYTALYDCSGLGLSIDDLHLNLNHR